MHGTNIGVNDSRCLKGSTSAGRPPHSQHSLTPTLITHPLAEVTCHVGFLLKVEYLKKSLPQGPFSGSFPAEHTLSPD